MTALAGTAERSLESLASGGRLPVARIPSWLAGACLDAARWIETHGFPTRKEEDWRYLSLEPVLAESFEMGAVDRAPRSGGGWADEALDACSLGLGGARLVFVNGRFAPRLSRLTWPHGVSSLGSTLATDDAHARHRARLLSGEPRHAFAALNTALASDGALVEIPDGVVLDEAIELIFLTDPGERAPFTCPRSILCLGRDARATIVETHAGPAGTRSCTNAVTDVVLDAGAALEHYRLQDESEDAFHFSSLNVRQADGSHVRAHLVALGASIARHEVRVLLSGEGAAVEIDAFSLERGNQYHDHPVLVEHAAPGCASRQHSIGIADDHARGVFNGHVVVHPGAAGTDASQYNKNLLLSDHAEIDTRPRLEIFADDVACAHGAAVGRLDADALFYLRSRGIDESLARGLLVQGFATQALERLALAPFRQRAEALIAGRLALDGDGAPGAVPRDEPRSGQDR